MKVSLQVICIDCGGPVEAGKNRCAAHLRRPSDRAVADDMPESLRKIEERAASCRCFECETRTQPRALVALSDDRQWLVVLEPEHNEFIVMEWCPADTEYYDSFVRTRSFQDRRNYEPIPGIKDTGQSAEDVLRDFLRGRDA